MRWTRPFDPKAELIWIGGRLHGPGGRARHLILALDTGTARTLIEPRIAQAVGLHEGLAVGYGAVRGVAGPPVRGPRVIAPAFQALGRMVQDFEVVCLPLTKDQRVDGILGLDFVRGLKLTLDFEIGLITLAEGAGG